MASTKDKKNCECYVFLVSLLCIYHDGIECKGHRLSGRTFTVMIFGLQAITNFTLIAAIERIHSFENWLEKYCQHHNVKTA